MDDATDRASAAPDEWTLARRHAFRRALEERRLRLVRASQLTALLLVVTVAAGVVFRLPASWWMPAVGVVALCAVVFRLGTWKCPDCGERLPSRRAASVCLGCGAPLEEKGPGGLSRRGPV